MSAAKTQSISIQKADLNLISSMREGLDRVAKEKVFIEMIEAPPLEKVIGFQSKLLDLGLPALYAVAGDQVVGWCDIHVSENPRMNHRGVLGMGIIAEYRGQGVGSRLLAQTIEQAKTFGLEKIELTVYTSNLAAIALYKKHGFEQEGCLRAYRKLEGQTYDCLSMAKFL